MPDMAAANTTTDKLRYDGYTIFCEPRITSNSYYESIVAAHDNNRIEILYPVAPVEMNTRTKG